MTECKTCGKPIATQADWDKFRAGEGSHICWSGVARCINEPVDWFARCRELEAENVRLRGYVESDAFCPCCGETERCFDGCTYKVDDRHGAAKMEQARAALKGGQDE